MIDLPGASAYLKELAAVSPEEVNEDNEDEIEAYNAGIDFDNHVEDADLEAGVSDDTYHLRTPPMSNKHIKLDPEYLNNQLKKASEAIVVASTRTEYERFACLLKDYYCLH